MPILESEADPCSRKQPKQGIQHKAWAPIQARADLAAAARHPRPQQKLQKAPAMVSKSKALLSKAVSWFAREGRPSESSRQKQSWQLLRGILDLSGRTAQCSS